MITSILFFLCIFSFVFLALRSSVRILFSKIIFFSLIYNSKYDYGRHFQKSKTVTSIVLSGPSILKDTGISNFSSFPIFNQIFEKQSVGFHKISIYASHYILDHTSSNIYHVLFPQFLPLISFIVLRFRTLSLVIFSV